LETTKYLDILFGAALSLVIALVAFFLNWWKDSLSKKNDENRKHVIALKAVEHELVQIAIKIKIQGKLTENIQEQEGRAAYPVYLPISLSIDAWKANIPNLSIGDDISVLYDVYSNIEAVNEMGKIAVNSSPEDRVRISGQQTDYIVKNIYPSIKPAITMLRKKIDELE
jgi:hypothetical protein